MSRIKLGITLYCYTAEYAKGIFSYEDCVAAAAANGIDGYEIVATQMIPSYPFVSDEFVGLTQALRQKYGIGPVCYAANMDRGMLKSRDLSEDEMVARCLNDIRSAHKLGCGIVRQQFLLSPSGLKRIVPYAKQYGIKVGIEIHNPETPSTAITREYLKVIKESGSQYIGLIPDFGCFATKPNKPHWDEALANGAPLKLLEMAAQMRYDGVPLHKAMERLKEAGANDAVFGAFQGMYGFVTFYKEPDLKGLEEILPYCIHFHGKFHYLDESNKEASIPYEDILPVIARSDYKGYIMSEYEDHVSGRAVEMTRRHIAMEKEILNDK